MSETTIRPTKKQQHLLGFIQGFITEHGYSPSYREIMNGLSYNSVATVALHVNSLIKRGHLRKRDHSARSLEIVSDTDVKPLKPSDVKPSEERWLVEKVEHYFARLESARDIAAAELDEVYVLLGALKVLGMDGAVQSFIPRLTTLRDRLAQAKVTVA